ncbi:hypothetical protein B0H63DRAFT_450646 [Podospora didyma]|uniref:Uncharacterized protein n=1 Tax=Podospora didyma TaxID=330526 RepID=A0AAE0NGZ0_9PEZI|nr:hypothetical protein B0H63DRAFT_450646 [Podospora didyma]
MLGLLAMLLAAAPMLLSTADAKPERIRSDQSPTFHYTLQTYPKNSNTIQSTNTSLFMNIAASESTSYKTVTFDKTATTTAWGLEGDTIITTRSSGFGRQLDFVVCRLDSQYWQVFFQTGSAVPSGACSNYQSLHLPCLC